MRLGLITLAVVMTFALGLLSSSAQEPKQRKDDDREPINKKFEDPNMDVAEFIKRFETESREVYAKRAEIVAACAIRPGMGVADVGAGTGLYTFLFAEKVGPEGTVYAVDIAPRFLKYLGEQAEKRGLAKVVKPLKGGQETTHLPPASVDLVFICDAYHHFEKPGPMLASIHAALRPGGRVVLIDFDKRPDASAFVKGHARAEKEVYFKEFRVGRICQARDWKRPILEGELRRGLPEGRPNHKTLIGREILRPTLTESPNSHIVF